MWDKVDRLVCYLLSVPNVVTVDSQLEGTQ